jgi:hypothetical protein
VQRTRPIAARDFSCVIRQTPLERDRIGFGHVE